MMDRQRIRSFLSFNAIAVALGWSYATTIVEIAQRWSTSPEYSHGWLIPAFSLWLIHTDRGRQSVSWLTAQTVVGLSILALGFYLLGSEPKTVQSVSLWGAILVCCGVATCLSEWLVPSKTGAWLLGGALLLIGLGLRIAVTWYFIEWFDELSLIPVLAGLALIVFGSPEAPRLLPAIGFLTLMVPLPFTLETALRDPLRKVATRCSTYVLQTIGLPTVTEGYVIVIGDARIGVTEACSGLSMLMVFAALCVGLLLIVQRAWWYRAVIFLSFPAIAVLANVFRIVVTAALHAGGFEKLADVTFHDLAGLAMMPVGMALLWAEMAYLDRLIVQRTETRVSQLLLGIESPEQQLVAS